MGRGTATGQHQSVRQGGPDPLVDGAADPGQVPQLFGGMGTVNMNADRCQEAAVPWAGPMPKMLRKLTHFRAPGMGDPMWSGRCVYDLPGENPSFSEYDQNDIYVTDSNLNHSISGGVDRRSGLLPPQEPTQSRRARVSAVRTSAPAASFFQGFANLHWSGLMAGYRPMIQPRPLTQNFNPNQMGAKELNKATSYKPFPPMGSIVSMYGTDKAI